MLAQPCFVESRLVGELYLLQGFGEGLLLGKVLVVGDDGKDSELHGASCAGGVGGCRRVLLRIYPMGLMVQVPVTGESIRGKVTV